MRYAVGFIGLTVAQCSLATYGLAAAGHGFFGGMLLPWVAFLAQLWLVMSAGKKLSLQ